MLTASHFKEGRTMKRLAISFLAAAALAGCAKLGLETVESTPSEGQTPFVLYVSTPSEDRQPSETKTSFNKETYEVTWKDGDALAVTIGGKLYKFTKVKGQENAFSCDKFTPEDGVEYEYDILYPYSDNGQFATSGYVKTPMHGTAKAVGSASPNVGLEQLTGVIKVTIKNENTSGTAKLTTLRVERTDGGILGGQHTLAGPVDGKTDNCTTVVRQNEKIEAGKSIDMYLQCAPFMAKKGTSLCIKYVIDGAQYMATKTFSKDIEFAAGKVNGTSVSFGESHFIEGTAIADGVQEMTKCLEKCNLYAFRAEFSEGDFRIRVTGENGGIYAPVLGNDISDGQTVDLVKNENGHWTIPAAGVYRVVVDFDTKKVAIYSSETDLQPFTVKWQPNWGAPTNTDNGHAWITTTVDTIYGRGESVGWAATGKDLKCKVSLADPQVLVYTGGVLGSGRTDFAIISSLKVDGYNGGNAYNTNNSYVFAPVYTGTNYDQSITLGKWMDMEGGSYLRGNYFKIPNSTNFIIFDIRNMKIWFEQR